MVFLSNRNYTLLFCLLGVAYLPGLFVPLMDNDSAHHANIALHMYLTGDYTSLVDQKGPYLDKPHLLFWLCAFSYKLFGVTTFAYKLPSFLFTVLGTYSTYRLGKTLYNKETGKLAALIVASAFAYILANNDVRMDAILTACVVFATWQLVEFIHNKKILNVAGAALGLALAFATKGHIGVIVPLAGAFFYILYKKDWKLFISWQWALMALCFALFISPVVYCYYLQFNLHPEITVRGRDHINGVRFILWDQVFERFEGDNFGKYGQRDRLFFFHSFLWAFFPWCILAYIVLFGRLKSFLSRKEEWLTTGMFVTAMVGISFSGFKLPHYLNIIFPVAAIMVASFILSKSGEVKWIKSIFNIQLVVSCFLLLSLVIVNGWAFPINNTWVLFIILSLVLLFYLFINSGFAKLQKAVLISVAAMVIGFFSLNANFYFQLLTYQGGNELAFEARNIIDPANVYVWKSPQAHSWNFYTASNQQYFTDSIYAPGKKTWLLFDAASLKEIEEEGYLIKEKFSVVNFPVTKLRLPFIDPASREKVCPHLVLAEITGRNPVNTAPAFVNAVSYLQK